MKKVKSNIVCAGMDVHYKFSNVTFRDSSGKVVSRQHLNHPDRNQLTMRMNHWPKGVPVVLEASFGWGWLSDLLIEAGLEPQLSNCYKLEQMRKARGCINRDGPYFITNVTYFDWWATDKFIIFYLLFMAFSLCPVPSVADFYFVIVRVHSWFCN